MSLRKIVDQSVANTFAAGAQWYAMHMGGVDSATIRVGTWEQDHHYQRMVKAQQEAATDAVGRAIMRAALAAVQEQTELF